MKIGFAGVTADLLHAGHLAHLEEAKRYCDYLIVGLNVNPCDRSYKNKPIESVFERYMRLRACKWVDEIICYDGEKDLELLTATLPFDIKFIGSDYKGKDFTGRDMCLKRGIEIHYCDRYHDLSTTKLRERIKNAN